MKLLTPVLLLLAACFARAERKEQSRFRISEDEQIIQCVDEEQERPFCWLALQKGGEEPVVFWSREAGDVISWYDNPGSIAGADKSGDDVFVVLMYQNVMMYFIQANLKTMRERMTPTSRFEFQEKFELQTNGKFKVKAPNQVLGWNTATGKSRLLEWREDGEPYLDGEPFFHIRSLPSPARYSGTAVTPAVSAPLVPPPDALNPHPSRGKKAGATPWSEPFLWVAGTFLLAAGGVWFYARRRQR